MGLPMAPEATSQVYLRTESLGKQNPIGQGRANITATPVTARKGGHCESSPQRGILETDAIQKNQPPRDTRVTHLARPAPGPRTFTLAGFALSNALPRYSHGSFPHVPQVFAQMYPFLRDLL